MPAFKTSFRPKSARRFFSAQKCDPVTSSTRLNLEYLEPRVLLAVDAVNPLKDAALLSSLDKDAPDSADSLAAPHAIANDIRPTYWADSYEPNDSYAAAVDWATLSGNYNAGNLTIHDSYDEDWYCFTTTAAGTSADSITINFSDLHGDLDAYLYDSQLQVVDEAESTSDNEILSLDALAAGTYYLRVRGYDGAVNSYSISLALPQGTTGDAYEPNDTWAAASDLGTLTGNNQITNLTISNSDDVDYFSFTTEAVGTWAHSVSIAFTHSQGDLDMYLYNAGGNEVGHSTSVSNNETISLQNLDAGAYYLKVYGYQGALNSYTLTIAAPESSSQGDDYESNDTFETAASLGTVSGNQTLSNLTIHDADDIDYFTFTTSDQGTSSHYVQVDFAHVDGDLDMYLYDSNQQVIAHSTSVTDNEQTELTGLPAGTYYIAVYGYGNAVNTYDLNLVLPVSSFGTDTYESNDSFETASNLNTISGNSQLDNLSIHDDTDIDYFQFTLAGEGSSSSYAAIDFSHADGDLDLQLYDSNYNALESSTSVTDGENISLQGRPAGTYYLVVYGYRGDTNNYTLSLSGPESAQGTLTPDPMEANDSFAAAYDLRSISGTQSFTGLNIHDGDDIDYYQFELTAAATSSHYIDVLFTDADGDIDVVLYDAQQQQLVNSNSSTDNERISLAGLQTGTYYLVVYCYDEVANHYDLTFAAPTDTLSPDAYEPNNTTSAPADLRTLTGRTSLTGLTVDVNSDVDYFSFTTVAAAASSHYVSLEFAHADGDLALWLYDSTMTLITQADTQTDDERISMADLPAGDYIIKVAATAGASTNSYDLTFNMPMAQGELAEWTILVYCDGDNNLESAAVDDINEMEAAPLGDNFQIGILVDRINGYDSTNGNWTDTRRGIIQSDNDTSTISSTLVSMGELNMGDPDTLTAFIEWGVQTLPAQNYALVLWDHGAATYGACSDDTSNHDILSLAEIASALDSAGQHFDVIGFDACLMATVESAYAVADYADYYIASEETEGNDGWDYTDFIRDMQALPTLTPQQFASELITSSRDDPSISTLSATRTDNTLATAISQLVSTSLSQGSTADWENIIRARNAAPAYYYTEFRDLGGFMDAVISYVDNNAIVSAAQNVLDALDDAIVNNYSTAQKSGTGLSIYLPASTDSVYSGYDSLAFSTDTSWDSFAQRLTGQRITDSIVTMDWSESNNNAASAYNLQTVSGPDLVYANLSIHTSNDVDWFRFTTAAVGEDTDAVTISFTNSQGNIDLYLYDQTQSLLASSTGSGDSETVSLTDLAAGQYYIKIISASGTTNPQYTMVIDAPAIEPDWAEGGGGNDTIGKASALSLDTVYGGLNLLQDDVDWYRIDIDRLPVEDGLRITTAYDTASGSITIALYDADGQWVANSTAAESGAIVELSESTASRYYAQINGANIDTILTYSLVAEQGELEIEPTTVPFDNGQLEYTLDGVTVKIKLTGDGTGSIVYTNGDNAAPDIILNSVTSSDSLTISSSGGDALINDITVNGSLKKLQAKTTDLTGSMTVSGSLGMLTLDDLLNADITVTGNQQDIKVKLDQVDITSFTFAGTVNTFQAASFSTGTLTADTISKVKVKSGDVAAWFYAQQGAISNLSLPADFSGGASAADDIGKLIVKGSFSGTARAANDILALTANALDQALLSAGDDIGKVIVKGDVADSYLLAGYDLGSDSIFNDNDTLSSGDISKFIAKGTFADSFVSAGVLPLAPRTQQLDLAGSSAGSGSIHSIKLGNVDTTGNDPFGLYAASLINNGKLEAAGSFEIQLL